MEYFFLVFLWVILVGFGLRIIMVRSMNSSWFWQKQVGHWNKKIVAVSVLNRLMRYQWLTKPRWFVNWSVNKEKLENKVFLSGDVVSFSQFLGIKQAIFTLCVIYFWLYLWFGDVSWGNAFWLFLIYVILYLIPDIWLRVQIEKRQKRFSEEVPYFIDLLALTLQTGMNIEQALRYISDKKEGDLSILIRRQLQFLSYGKSLESILGVLRSAVPISDWQNFISSIQQSRKLGVSLAHTLEIQSEIIRTRRRQRAEELSRTAAVKISLPLVLFIFPALLIIYIGPGIIRLM